MVSKTGRSPVLAIAAGLALSACLPKEGISTPSSPAHSNTPPTISGTPVTQAIAGSAYSFQPLASDRDGDVLRFSASGLPPWASINSDTGLVSGMPSTADVGSTSTVVIRASDGDEVATLPAFTIVVSARLGNVPQPPGNRPPSIAGPPPTKVSAGSNYYFMPRASDPDSDALEFSVSPGSLPAWAAFDPANGSISGVPGPEHIGVYPNIVLSVSDGTASASLPPFTITVAAAAPSTGSASLTWIAPTTYTDGSGLPPSDLAAYRVYHGRSATSLTQITSVDGSTTILTVDALDRGTHYFAITAISKSGVESSLSEVGSKTIL